MDQKNTFPQIVTNEASAVLPPPSRCENRTLKDSAGSWRTWRVLPRVISGAIGGAFRGIKERGRGVESVNNCNIKIVEIEK